MITKFQIFESKNKNEKEKEKGKEKWFYHATRPETLPHIVRDGLTPNINRKTNWGDPDDDFLGEWSRGKVFVTSEFPTAIFYGQVVNNYSHKFWPILKIKLDPNTLIKDKKSDNDWYSEEPINGEFQIYTYRKPYWDDRNWKNLTPKLAEIITTQNLDNLFDINERLVLESSSGVINWEELRETIPNSVYLKAKKMYTDVEGNPNLVGDSDVVQGWWIETHTLGCRNAANEPEENWIDSHFEIFDEYSKDNISYVVPAEDFIFVTLTPQKENLVEGLISTSPVKKTIKMLKRKFPDYYVGLQTSEGDIMISAGRKEYIDDIKGIDNICRQLGWFISHGNIPSENLYYKYDEPEFFDQKYEEIIIKPKFDGKDIPGNPSIMYHVTPKRNVDKILKMGLVPKHKDKLVHHPDRVYLLDELELAWGLKMEFQRLYHMEYEILKVSMKDVDVRLYADVDYPQHGFYTLENIPPKFISIFPKEQYRKHWTV